MDAKSFLKSKTLWANLGALVAAAGDYFSTGNTSAIYVAGLAVVNMVLRFVTKQPIDTGV